MAAARDCGLRAGLSGGLARNGGRAVPLCSRRLAAAGEHGCGDPCAGVPWPLAAWPPKVLVFPFGSLCYHGRLSGFHVPWPFAGATKALLWCLRCLGSDVVYLQSSAATLVTMVASQQRCCWMHMHTRNQNLAVPTLTKAARLVLCPLAPSAGILDYPQLSKPTLEYKQPQADADRWTTGRPIMLAAPA